MKLVLVYRSGGGEPCGSYLNIRCFDGDSEEWLLVTLEEAVKAAKAVTEAQQADRRRWHEARPNDNLGDWLLAAPPPPDSRFVFHGNTLDWHDFWADDKFYAPEIHELHRFHEAGKLRGYD